MSTTVLVSGANGFVGKHIVVQLLKQNYRVIGSVRSAAKGEKLKMQLNNDNFDYEVVESLESDGSFDDVFKRHPEITAFLHSASPFDLTLQDLEKDMLIPAIDGTINALKSAKAHGHNVKKFVLTSSALSMINVLRPTLKPLDENTWSDMTWEEALSNVRLAYSGSKLFAEKAAWDFVEKENPSFSLTVLNPVWIFGPQAFDEDAKAPINSSNTTLLSVLKLNSTDPVPPQAGGSFIDVRDVALAHVRAIESKEVNGRRVLVSNLPWSPQIAIDSIRKQFPQFDKLPLGNPGEQPFGSQGVVDLLTKNLNVELTSWDTVIHDTVKQYLGKN